jgi:D-alanine-D-alanine ligase
MEKLKVAVVFGGRSAEHEVSLQSAVNVLAALDREKYIPILIGIDRKGKWYLNDRSLDLLDAENPERIRMNTGQNEVTVVTAGKDHRLIDLKNYNDLGKIDVLFPVLHGPYGEDGSIQGLAKLADIPCVGAGILGSAVGMDKAVMKRLLRESGIPIAPFLFFRNYEQQSISYDGISRELGPDVYIKPANLGSSVGISPASSPEEFVRGIENAFAYDTKIIIEQAVQGREVECSVLGRTHPEASLPGEVITPGGFYSYQAKYIDENGAVLEIPAKLEENQVKQIQALAVETFISLNCSGMARVDMFIRNSDGQILVNEINTIPGFTSISMYPKLWEISGVSNTELVERLIRISLEEYDEAKNLRDTPKIIQT